MNTYAQLIIKETGQTIVYAGTHKDRLRYVSADAGDHYFYADDVQPLIDSGYFSK